MTILYLDSFLVRFRRQIKFIKRDSPANAKRFAADVRTAIGKIKAHPRAYRQSIYFEDENIYLRVTPSHFVFNPIYWFHQVSD